MRLAVLVVTAAVTVLGSARVSPAVASKHTCGSGVSAAGGAYGYAGHEANAAAAGVRATVTPLIPPHVVDGHVAAWVGVGGLRTTTSGADEWLQAGIASVDGSLFAYAEISHNGRPPALHVLRADVAVGESHRLAVAGVTGRRGWWRVWLDAAPVGAPVRLAGSSDGWHPIATAESFTLDANACNSFSFRFNRVEVLRAPGGAWRSFVSARHFLDRGYALQQLNAGGLFGFNAKSVT